MLPPAAARPDASQDGNWSDVSGENFLRTLLTQPIEDISGSFSDEEPQFANASPIGGDPRLVAQRIMDYRCDGRAQRSQRGVGSTGPAGPACGAPTALPLLLLCSVGCQQALLCRQGERGGRGQRGASLPASRAASTAAAGPCCRHAIAKEWIEELKAVQEENKLLLSESLMSSLAMPAGEGRSGELCVVFTCALGPHWCCGSPRIGAGRLWPRVRASGCCKPSPGARGLPVLVPPRPRPRPR